MYTRSRSSGGGPGFGNGRGQMMNSGNGNSFQGQNPYNNQQQGGNYMQSNFKPGMLQPSAPFKPAGAPVTAIQQQAIKTRQQQQPQNPKPPQQQQQQQQQGPKTPQQQQQQPQQQQQNQQQAVSTPATPRLKPILKQTLNPVVANVPATPTTGNTQTTATPSPVPAPSSSPATAVPANTATTPSVQAPINKTPSPVATPAAPVAKIDVVPAITAEGSTDEVSTQNVDSTAEPMTIEAMDSDDPRRWAEDDQGRWNELDEQGGQWMDTEDGQQERPKWRRFKKLAGSKPNKKLKRLRMNQRLRKALMPKNAIMVLNEMKAGVQFTFPETQAIMPNSLFLVHAELEGKVYVGQGLSKPLARQNAAENALKCLLLEKMTAAAMKERVDSESETVMETQQVGEPIPTTTPPKEGENGEENPEETDDVPWSSLASFALYKLFLEWQNQGTVVPIPRPGVPTVTKNRTEPKPTGEKQLPPNASEIHPVMLLNQMKPGTTYTEVGRVGTPPNILFTLGVEISGVTYTGSAKNKKDAKKLAAKEALKALYNLDYPEELKSDNPDVSQ